METSRRRGELAIERLVHGHGGPAGRLGEPRSPRASRYDRFARGKARSGLAVAIAALAAGCALDWDLAPNPSPRAVNAPDASPPATDAGAAPQSTPSEDATAPDARPAAGGAVCARTSDCPNDAYCRFDDEMCGAKAGGHCASRTELCLDTDDACLCDGTVASRCAGQLVGVDVDVRNGCALRTGKYRCGYAMCSVDSEMCVQSNGERLQFDCWDKSGSCTSCASCPRPNCTCSENGGGLIYACP